MTKRTRSESSTAASVEPAERSASVNGHAAIGDDTFRLIPLGSIAPSPTNPRRTFDETALVTLAESIRSKGVLQAIIVRPRPEKSKATEPFEIICGERRWRAALHAELKVIPCQVRVMDDKTAAECAVVENDQREDVPPLEQAAGYKRLIELGDDVPTIAGKIGRPERYVAERLRLMSLTPKLQDDLQASKIGFGHAMMLCRLTAADQEIIRKERLYDRWDDRAAIAIPALRRSIREHCVHDLAAAGWKKDDATLVSSAGPCITCPKRRGHNPGLFDELLNGDGKKSKSDYCLDGTCYHAKEQALIQLRLKEAAEQSDKNVLRVSTEWYGTRDKEVKTAADVEILTPKQARKVDAKDRQPAVVVDGEGVGRIVEVRVRKRETYSGGGDARWRKQQAQQRQQQKYGRVAAIKAIGQVADKTAALFAGVVGWPRASVVTLRALAVQLISHGRSDACRLVAKRRELETEQYDHTDKVAKVAESIDNAPDLVALIAEVLAADKAMWWGNGHHTESGKAREFWKTWAVDQRKLINEEVAAANEKKALKTLKAKGKKAKGKKRAKATA